MRMSGTVHVMKISLSPDFGVLIGLHDVYAFHKVIYTGFSYMTHTQQAKQQVATGVVKKLLYWVGAG